MIFQSNYKHKQEEAMMKSLSRSFFASAISAVFVFAPNAYASSVNCDAQGPEALRVAIENAPEGATVEVNGDCVGVSVIVSTDGLTLTGGGSATITGDGLAAAITVIANRVTIADWAGIDGGERVGIIVRASGSAVITNNSSIKGARGVEVSEAAFSKIENSNLSDSQVGAPGDGLLVTLGGNARVDGSQFSGNKGRGIVIANSGSALIGEDNTIFGNGQEGIGIYQGVMAVDGNNSTVSGNATLPEAFGDVRCFFASRIFVVNPFANADGILVKSSSCSLSPPGATLFTPPS